jgi:hypothetical protein
MTRYEGSCSRRSVFGTGAGKADRESERHVDRSIHLSTGRSSCHDAAELPGGAITEPKRAIRRQDFWESRSLPPVEE